VTKDDPFLSVMDIAAAVNVDAALDSVGGRTQQAIDVKAKAWSDIVKFGRTQAREAQW
jgi:fumarate hydratase class II